MCFCERGLSLKKEMLSRGPEKTNLRKKQEYMVCIFLAFLASHKIIGCCESLLPDMMRALWGCQSTHLTSEPWP